MEKKAQDSVEIKAFSEAAVAVWFPRKQTLRWKVAFERNVRRLLGITLWKRWEGNRSGRG